MFRILVMNILLLILIQIWTSAAKEPSADLPTGPLNDIQMKMRRGKFACGSELGGVCVYRKKSCPKKFSSEKSEGKPFCSKKHRCCYTVNPTCYLESTQKKSAISIFRKMNFSVKIPDSVPCVNNVPAEINDWCDDYTPANGPRPTGINKYWCYVEVNGANAPPVARDCAFTPDGATLNPCITNRGIQARCDRHRRTYINQNNIPTTVDVNYRWCYTSPDHVGFCDDDPCANINTSFNHKHICDSCTDDTDGNIALAYINNFRTSDVPSGTIFIRIQGNAFEFGSRNCNRRRYDVCRMRYNVVAWQCSIKTNNQGVTSWDRCNLITGGCRGDYDIASGHFFYQSCN